MSSFAPSPVIDGILQRWVLNPQNEFLQVVGANLRSEHRISGSRAEHFFEVTGRPQATDALQRAFLDYYQDWVCQQPKETYLSESRNGHNILSDTNQKGVRELAHVLNLSRWVESLRTRSPGGLRLEAGFARLSDSAVSSGEVSDFISLLCDAINYHRDQRPVWAADWRRFSRAIGDGDVSSWSAAVGLWRLPGTWQVILKYPASAVTPLIRPTILDCPLNMFHFPSPPCFPQRAGGLIMNLHSVRQQIPLVPEWIHPPIDWKPEYFVGFPGQVEPTGSAHVWIFREQHRDRLKRRFRSKLDGWLPEK